MAQLGLWTEQDVADLFSVRAHQVGRRMERAGRVTSAELDTRGRALHGAVLCDCGTVHRVTVTFTVEDGRLLPLRVRCECGSPEACAHAVAVLLRYVRASTGGGHRVPVEPWRTDLDTLLAEPPAPSPRPNPSGCSSRS